MRANDATAWFARMRSDSRTLEDEAAFERWLAEDPAHERDYLELQLLWGDLDRFRDAPALAQVREAARTESQRAAHVMRWTLRLSGARFAATAAAFAAALALVFLVANPATFSDATYKTAVGDRQSVRLADGSDVVLNTDSLLRVRYRPWAREVTLERGQAYFRVAHAIVRPFDVQAGTSRIRAVGTAFDVYMHDGEVKVTLIEGRVEVTERPRDEASTSAPMPARAELSPGEGIAVSPAGISPVRMASVAQTTAWLEGRLVFENERLQDAVAEVNRYSPTRLVILDEGIADLRISGVFRAGRAETFVDALQSSFAIEAHRAADGTLILKPGTRSP